MSEDLGPFIIHINGAEKQIGSLGELRKRLVELRYLLPSGISGEAYCDALKEYNELAAVWRELIKRGIIKKGVMHKTVIPSAPPEGTAPPV